MLDGVHQPTKFTGKHKGLAVHIDQTNILSFCNWMSFNVAEIKQKRLRPMLVLSLRKLCLPAGLSHSSERSFRIGPFSQTRALLCVNNSESVVTSVNVRAGFHTSVESNQAITLVLFLLRFETGQVV